MGDSMLNTLLETLKGMISPTVIWIAVGLFLILTALLAYGFYKNPKRAADTIGYTLSGLRHIRDGLIGLFRRKKRETGGRHTPPSLATISDLAGVDVKRPHKERDDDD